MSGTATTQLEIGMIHQQVWSTYLIELVVVVTARLHDHPALSGVTKVCPGTRHPGCPPLARTRTEAKLTVPTHRPHAVGRTGRGKEAPPSGRAETIVPISGHHHRRPQGQALRAACGRP
jgi:hypothetical protein